MLNLFVDTLESARKIVSYIFTKVSEIPRYDAIAILTAFIRHKIFQVPDDNVASFS